MKRKILFWRKFQSPKTSIFFLTLNNQVSFTNSIIIQTFNVPWGLAEFGLSRQFSQFLEHQKDKDSQLFCHRCAPSGNPWWHPSPFPWQAADPGQLYSGPVLHAGSKCLCQTRKDNWTQRGDWEDPMGFIWTHQPCLRGCTNSCHVRTNLLAWTVSQVQILFPEDISA